MTPSHPRRARAWLVPLILLACDQRLPTEPGTPFVASDTTSTTVPTPQAPAGLFSDRARLMDPTRYPLLSDAADLAAGRYRYRIPAGSPVALTRDDYLVTAAGGESVVRLVLGSRTAGDELVVETAAAYWSSIMHSGTYGVTMPLKGDGPAISANGEALNPRTVEPAPLDLGTLETTLGPLDICQVLDDNWPTPVCGLEQTLEIDKGVSLSLAGVIDSLQVGGNFSATGDVAIRMTVDAGGLTGGRAPVFSPCNVAPYLGCITTPTGAALIDWLRKYVPAIPDGSLPAVRLCLPGAPVRVQAGYWDRSNRFFPRWVPPVFQVCRVTDFGQLPTIVLPSITEASATVSPHLRGELRLRVQGGGRIELKIPIPKASVSAAYGSDNFKAKIAAGLFLGLDLSLKRGGGTLLLTFDHAGTVLQRWTDAEGWSSDHQATTAERNAQVVSVDNDSIVIKIAPDLEVTAELCLAAISCDNQGNLELPLINLGVTAAVSEMVEATWTTVTLPQPDTVLFNRKLALDGSYGFTVGAKLALPQIGFFLPTVSLAWDHTFSCCTIPLADFWGQGTLNAVATTTGANPDLDGYQVTVVRADTFPAILRAGVAARLGSARDRGTLLSYLIGSGDSVQFDHQPGAMCGAVYSDAQAFFAGAVWGLALNGLRALGLGVPAYAVTLPCPLLVARYTVTLGGVSDNCTVAGGPTRDVWLKPSTLRFGEETRVTFAVTCDGAGPVGDLRLTTNTSAGIESPPDYVVSLDGEPWGRVPLSATILLTDLATGNRTVALSAGPTNCSVPEPVQVTVAEGEIVDVTFPQPLCAVPQFGPGTVTVATTTTGDGIDPDGYQIKLDGVHRAAAAANGGGTVESVPALVPGAVQVSGLTGNCRATSPNPFIVTLDADALPVTVPFTAGCTAARVDTLQGTIETAGSPAPSVWLRRADGGTVRLTGPATADLSRLAGAPVEVSGVTAGTSLEVYGYTFQASASEPRWVGIVLQRDAEWWLFGEDATRLVNPPSGLTAAAGALVWITGSQSETGVTPRAFGVIREAQP